MKKALRSLLCALCALALSTIPTHASLSIQNPKDQPGYPGRSDVAHGSVVTDGYNVRSGFRSINDDIADGIVPVEAGRVLQRAGWDGAPLSFADKQALSRYVDANGHSFAYNVQVAYEASKLWKDGQDDPTQPTPTAAPTPVPQGSGLYPSSHEISQKLPAGSKIRRAVGAFETAWGGLNAYRSQARADGVPDGAESLVAAQQGLVAFYQAILEAFQNGEDGITDPGQREAAQRAADAVWDAVHAARRQALAAKATGYQLVPGDPREPTFRHSRLNRIAWHALSNLSAAAGLYGLRGEVLANGQRDAEYVNAFQSFDDQDPLNTLVVGSGGVNTH